MQETLQGTYNALIYHIHICMWDQIIVFDNVQELNISFTKNMYILEKFLITSTN